jgi:chemotaxis protein histidine kinase CheA
MDLELKIVSLIKALDDVFVPVIKNALITDKLSATKENLELLVTSGFCGNLILNAMLDLVPDNKENAPLITMIKDWAALRAEELTAIFSMTKEQKAVIVEAEKVAEEKAAEEKAAKEKAAKEKAAKEKAEAEKLEVEKKAAEALAKIEADEEEAKNKVVKAKKVAAAIQEKQGLFKALLSLIKTPAVVKNAEQEIKEAEANLAKIETEKVEAEKEAAEKAKAEIENAPWFVNAKSVVAGQIDKKELDGYLLDALTAWIKNPKAFTAVTALMIVGLDKATKNNSDANLVIAKAFITGLKHIIALPVADPDVTTIGEYGKFLGKKHWQGTDAEKQFTTDAEKQFTYDVLAISMKLFIEEVSKPKSK